MMNLFFFLATAILTLAISYLYAEGKLKKETYNNWYEKFATNGKRIFLCSILYVLIGGWQVIYNYSLEAEKDSTQKEIHQLSLKNTHLTISNMWADLLYDKSFNDTIPHLRKTKEAYQKITDLVNSQLANPVLKSNPVVKKIWEETSESLRALSDTILFENSNTHIHIRGVLLEVLQRFIRENVAYLENNNNTFYNN